MKIALSWLKQYINIELTAEELGKKLTSIGLELEAIETYEQIPGSLEGMVIGEVLSKEKHPNADKLSVTTVDIGKETPAPIVCGAANVATGQKVVVATLDAMLYPTGGEPFQIKKSKIRGEVSEGMICAEDEIGLGSSHEGIMVLNTNLPNGTPAAEYFKPFKDEVLVIGLTPNRADAASHWGVARDLRALFNQELSLPDLSGFQIDHADLPIEVLVENTEACPRYSGITLTGLTVKESPPWLQNRLKSIGLSPINNIVDVTNFVLHELGQPLHAFDADQIAGSKVIVKTLAQDTRFVTLDGQERKLSQNDLMICDGDEKPMCIAGVFGGLKSGVSNTTTRVFLESAYFNPGYVRRTSQYHGLKTDASFRFERGTDPNATLLALRRAALLIKEVAGGKIASGIVDVYPQAIDHFVFPVKYKSIDRLIGKKLDRELIKNILSLLEIGISEENEIGFTVSVPPYRVDVQREADIIEEIARMYGYDHIEPGETLGASYLAEFPEPDPHKLQYQISQMLAAQGFSEMMNNSLTKPSYIHLLEDLKEDNNVVILNRLSEDLEVMRQTLIFSGLEVLAYNLNRRQNDLKFFEFGKVYQKNKPEAAGLDKYEEHVRLALLLTGNQHAQTWIAPVHAKEPEKSALSFYHVAAYVQHILKRLNLTSFDTETLNQDAFDYGLTYVYRKKPVAHLGLLKKKLGKAFNIVQPIFYAELDWELLVNQYQSHVKIEEISRFPEVRRDLSLVLDKKITFQEVKALALSKEKTLLKSLNVFDVYQGPNIEANKKAYAISLILEDKTQTLTDKVIEKTMNKLIQAFETELGASIRK